MVATYPPVSSWDAAGAESFLGALDRASNAATSAPFGLYVHVPFCSNRCDFCYYLAYDDGREEIAAYLDCVAAELERYVARPRLAGRPLSYVYFGGGTPSILSRKRIGAWLRRLQTVLSWEDVREATFECAPASVRHDKLETLREAGMTRISLGVRQLDDEVLATNGWTHSVGDVERAVADVRGVGFEVLDLDLVVGMAGETDRSFSTGLLRAIDLGPESISVCRPTTPQNTPLRRSVREESRVEPVTGGDENRRRWDLAYDRLEQAGYSWTSAYTAVRDPEAHPFVFQDEQFTGGDLIGIGASSVGYVDGAHEQDHPSLDRYVAAVAGGGLPLWRGHVLTRAERLVRELVLRLKSGRVDLATLDRRYGRESTRRFDGSFARLAGEGLLTLDGRRVTLTPGGLARVDQLIPEFYLPEHRGLRCC